MLKASLMPFVVAGLLISATDLFAHANIVPKDNLDSYSGRQYMEGSSAFIQIHLSHGCRNEDRTKTYATKHVSIVFPSANDLAGIAFTEDRQGNRYAGNAIMSPKPQVDSDWDEIQIKHGDVAEYYNHGISSNDVRAIHWLGGEVPDSMYDNLALKVNLPTLQNCVSRLKVYLPVVQYCEDDRVLAWLKQATPSFPANVISPGYAPYVEIIRNMLSNPLPESCGGAGSTEQAYPSSTDIDKYLPIDDD